jgi:hypothetical protein
MYTTKFCAAFIFIVTLYNLCMIYSFYKQRGGSDKSTFHLWLSYDYILLSTFLNLLLEYYNAFVRYDCTHHVLIRSLKWLIKNKNKKNNKKIFTTITARTLPPLAIFQHLIQISKEAEPLTYVQGNRLIVCPFYDYTVRLFEFRFMEMLTSYNIFENH